MAAILTYLAILCVPLGTIAVGTWSLRRHDRIYPTGKRVDGWRARRQFDAGAWLWRNGS